MLKPFYRNPQFLIGDDGRVFSENQNKFIPLSLGNNGYYCFSFNCLINKKRMVYLVHRAVVETHIGAIGKGLHVNHKDGNRLNNCKENLEVVTPAENVKHSLEVLKNTGHLNRRLLEDVHILTVATMYGHTSMPTMGKALGVCHSSLQQVSEGVRYPEFKTYFSEKIENPLKLGAKFFRERNGRFQAIVNVKGRQKCLGTFGTKEEATTTSMNFINSTPV